MFLLALEHGSQTLQSGRCKRARKANKNMAHRHCRVEGARERGRPTRTSLTDIAEWKVQESEEGQQEHGSQTLQSGRCKRARKANKNMAHRHCRVEGARERGRPTRTWLTDIAEWKVQESEEGQQEHRSQTLQSGRCKRARKANKNSLTDIAEWKVQESEEGQQEHGSQTLQSGRCKRARKANKNIAHRHCRVEGARERGRPTRTSLTDIAEWKVQESEEGQQEHRSQTLQSGRCKRARKANKNIAHRHCRVEGARERGRPTRTWLTDIAEWKVQESEEGQQEHRSQTLQSGRCKRARKANKNMAHRHCRVEGARERGRPTRTWLTDIAEWKVQESEEGQQELPGSQTLQSGRCKRARKANKNWLTDIAEWKVQESEEGQQELPRSQTLQSGRCKRARKANKNMAHRHCRVEGARERGRPTRTSLTDIAEWKVQESEEGQQEHRSQTLQSGRCKRARKANKNMAHRHCRVEGARERGRPTRTSLTDIAEWKVQESEEGQQEHGSQTLQSGRSSERVLVGLQELALLHLPLCNARERGRPTRTCWPSSLTDIAEWKVQESEEGQQEHGSQTLQSGRCKRARKANKNMAHRHCRVEGARERGRPTRTWLTDIAEWKVQESEEGQQEHGSQTLQSGRCKRARKANKNMAHRHCRVEGARERGRPTRTWLTDIAEWKVQESEEGQQEHGSQTLQSGRCKRARKANKNLAHRHCRVEGARERGRPTRTWLTDIAEWKVQESEEGQQEHRSQTLQSGRCKRARKANKNMAHRHCRVEGARERGRPTRTWLTDIAEWKVQESEEGQQEHGSQTLQSGRCKRARKANKNMAHRHCRVEGARERGRPTRTWLTDIAEWKVQESEEGQQEHGSQTLQSGRCKRARKANKNIAHRHCRVEGARERGRPTRTWLTDIAEWKVQESEEGQQEHGSQTLQSGRCKRARKANKNMAHRHCRVEGARERGRPTRTWLTDIAEWKVQESEEGQQEHGSQTLQSGRCKRARKANKNMAHRHCRVEGARERGRPTRTWLTDIAEWKVQESEEGQQEHGSQTLQSGRCKRARKANKNLAHRHCRVEGARERGRPTRTWLTDIAEWKVQESEEGQQEHGSQTLQSGRCKRARKANKNMAHRHCRVEGARERGRPTRTWLTDIAEWKVQESEEGQQEHGSQTLQSGRCKRARKANKNMAHRHCRVEGARERGRPTRTSLTDIAEWKVQESEEGQQEHRSQTLQSGRCKRARKANKNMAHRHCRVEGARERGRPTRTWLTDIAEWKVQESEEGQQEHGSQTLQSGRCKRARKANKNMAHRHCRVEGARERGRPTRTWLTDIAEWKVQESEEGQQELGSQTLQSGRCKRARKANKNMAHRHCRVEGARERGRPTRTWLTDIAEWKVQESEEGQQEHGSQTLQSGRCKRARKANKNMAHRHCRVEGAHVLVGLPHSLDLPLCNVCEMFLLAFLALLASLCDVLVGLPRSLARTLQL